MSNDDNALAAKHLDAMRSSATWGQGPQPAGSDGTFYFDPDTGMRYDVVPPLAQTTDADAAPAAADASPVNKPKKGA